MLISSKSSFFLYALLRTTERSPALSEALSPAGLWNISIFFHFIPPLCGSRGLGTRTVRRGWVGVGSPGCLCAPIGRPCHPSARERAPIGCRRRIRRCPPLIEAQGGEKVINLHPSPFEITLTLWQTTTSPLKANEFDLFGCKNTRNRTEDAVTPRVLRTWRRHSPWCCSSCTPLFVFKQVCSSCLSSVPCRLPTAG